MEPEGTVEIKFRKKDLIKAMRRIDPAYKKLVEQLGERVQNAPPLRGQERPSPFRCWRVLVREKKSEGIPKPSYELVRDFKCSRVASQPHLATVGVFLTLHGQLALGVLAELKLGPLLCQARPVLQPLVCALGRRKV